MKSTQGNIGEKLGKTNEMHEQWKVHKEIVAKN